MLAVRQRRQQEREDRRSALSAWVLVNVNRNSKEKPDPFTFEEVVGWLGHGRGRPAQEARPGAPPTPEELKGKLGVIHLLHKGLYGENGQGEEGT